MSQPTWLNDDDTLPQWIGSLEVDGRSIKVRVSGRAVPSTLDRIRFVDPRTGQPRIVVAETGVWSGDINVDDAIPAEVVR